MVTERLEAEIRYKRAELAQIRAEVSDLQREIDEFALEYDHVVGSIEAQLDIIYQQIEALQRADLPNVDIRAALGDDYDSVEDQFRRAMDPNAPPRRPSIFTQPDDIKTLYRKLARKYHPDTTTDPVERARLTVIMAQINAAYREKNLEELYKYADQQPERPTVSPTVQVERKAPVSLIELNRQLDDEIAWARSQRISLLTSSLMILKIECKLARSRGRDLLQEYAARVGADLEAAIAELRALQNSGQ